MSSIIIWLSLFYILTSYCHPAGSKQKVAAQSIKALKEFIRSENVRGGIPTLVGEAGLQIGTMSKINTTKPTSELIWEIGDVVVPLVSAGLALIPGVGPIIGGATALLYGVLSHFLGGDVESPMKKIIDNINTELENIHKKFKALEKKMTEDMRRERNAQLRTIFNNAFYSEISRNDYICGKYARISKVYSEDLKNNRTIDESLRIEMVALIQDCDNFLKDTTEAFVYPEFADVLWVPSAIMTLLRISFLSEFANYGVSLKIDEETIVMFWKELKADIRRHLKFFVDASKNRAATLDLEQNLTHYEYGGCKIQKQLLYFDREIYPYGVPNYTVISDDESVVKLSDFNITAENDKIQHIQILYNEYRKQKSDGSDSVLNCLIGPTLISRLSRVAMTFRIIYVPQKSYQIRVLYFVQEGLTIFHHSYDKGLKIRSISAHKETEAEPFQVMRMTNEHPSRSPQRFAFKTAVYSVNCKPGNRIEDEECKFDGSSYIGRFVVETVHIFNVLSDNDSNSTIILEDVRHGMKDTLFLGVELIVRPCQDFLSTW